MNKPRFKQELVAETVEDGDSKFIDVMDPDSGNMFRFYEAEYAIACGMDGERDVAGLIRWASDELGLKASANEVNRVIATLGDLGYLDGVEQPRTAPAIEVVDQTQSQPATAPAKKPAVVEDGELARGVIAAKPAATREAPAENVELGRAGTSASAATKAPELETKAPDIALSNAGAGIQPPKPPVAPADDIPLGHVQHTSVPQHSDVSLDLSDGMKIQLDDVKEAVRASKVMSAVDVPKDMLDLIEGTSNKDKVGNEVKAATAVEQPKLAPETTKPVETKPIETKPAETKPVEAKKPDVEVKKPVDEKKPVEKKPVVVDKKPDVEVKKPVEPEKPGTSKALIVFFILVLLGAGGFALWKFVLNKPDAAEMNVPGPTGSGSATTTGSAGTETTTNGSAGSAETTGSATQTGSAGSAVPVGSGSDEVGSGSGSAEAMGSGSGSAVENAGSGSGVGSAAAVPPVPAAVVLVEEPGASTEVKGNGGKIEGIVAGKAVTKGAVLVKLAGATALEAEIKVLKQGIARNNNEIAVATKTKTDAEAAGDQETVASSDVVIEDRKKSLAEKTEQLKPKEGELQRLYIVAPAAGTWVPSAKAGEPANVVGKISADAALTATVKPKAAVPANGVVTLIHVASKRPLICKSQGPAEGSDGMIKVACKQDAIAKAKDGDEVTVK